MTMGALESEVTSPPPQHLNLQGDQTQQLLLPHSHPFNGVTLMVEANSHTLFHILRLYQEFSMFLKLSCFILKIM